MKNNAVFPFVAVVGQTEIKNALTWNLVNPRIGGVLISGEKGTAKSTLVRGVCQLSKEVDLVELPLNTTEDCLIGNIDFEHAIKYGERRFEPGIFKRADGNLLYVDEVNLLSDHLVKALLEVATSGENIIEREGLSYRHPSRFMLVGSMNPEEGSLRPQFLDRFGLYVEVTGVDDIRTRAEIIRRRIDYEDHGVVFAEKYQQRQEELTNRVAVAREQVAAVEVTENAMNLAASIVKEANCEGHRAELVIIETARAIAALDGRKLINIADIKEAARYALPHRIRENTDAPPPPLEGEPEEESEEEHQLEDNQPEEELAAPPDHQDQSEDSHPSEVPPDNEQETTADNSQNGDGLEQEAESNPSDHGNGNEAQEQVEDPGEVFQMARWISDTDKGVISRGSGKRSLMVTSSLQGRYVRNRQPGSGKISDIALDATLRMAAPYQHLRDKGGRAVAIEKQDIRVKVREKRTGNTILFVVDASGSMGANKRMKVVKGAILSMLSDAYQKRDKVGMIVFRQDCAELALGITRSVELAEKKLTVLPTGGRTPLAAGLQLAYEVIKAGKIKDPEMLPVMVLISDGKATYSHQGEPFGEALKVAERIAAEKIKSIVIDTDERFVKLNLARKLADKMSADRYQIDDLKALSLISAVSLSL